MCDQDSIEDTKAYLSQSAALTRRGFGALSAAAGLSMLLPRSPTLWRSPRPRLTSRRPTASQMPTLCIRPAARTPAY
jgi:hypothetical protein